MTKKELEGFHCTVEAAMAVMGGKYKAIIVWWLNERTVMRFSELQRAIPQATAKMLSQQLREMEADALVVRKVYPVVPPRTEYRLAPFGKSAARIVLAMDTWSNAYYRHFGATPPCDDAELISKSR